MSNNTGTIFSRIIRYSLRKKLIDRESFVAQYLAIALFTVGIVSTIGADDLLGAFAAGNYFDTFSETISTISISLR